MFPVSCLVRILSLNPPMLVVWAARIVLVAVSEFRQAGPSDLVVRFVHCVLSCRAKRLGGQERTGTGGSQPARLNRFVQAVSQCQSSGRCRMILRADVAILAGMVMSLRRIVPVVAFAKPWPAVVAAARGRLNAMTAKTSQALFAANDFEGR